MTLDELIEELQFIREQTEDGDINVVLYDPHIGESKHIDCLTVGSFTGIVTIWAKEWE